MLFIVKYAKSLPRAEDYQYPTTPIQTAPILTASVTVALPPPVIGYAIPSFHVLYDYAYLPEYDSWYVYMYS